MDIHPSGSMKRLNTAQKIDKICGLLLILSVSAFSLFMTIMSFLFTQRCGREAWGEIENGVPIYQIWDNPSYHLVGILLLFAFFAGIFRLRARISDRMLQGFQIGIALTAVLFSCLSFWAASAPP